jgi:hypothetical protein
MHRITVDVNVYDAESLHAEAVKAYCKGGASEADALAWLGTADAPNITNCLLELWAEYVPATAGYEFHRWADAERLD